MDGSGDPDAVLMQPVRDCNGHVVWRVKVPPGEFTCLDCGETTTGAYCWRCVDERKLISHHEAIKSARLVPTMSYLHDDEVERT